MNNLHIGLACNLGASTSILVSKMQAIVQQSEKLADKNIKIESFPASQINKSIQDYDIVLLAPQIAHRKDEISQLAAQYHVPVETINAQDFGAMNAAGILKEALYIIHSLKS